MNIKVNNHAEFTICLQCLSGLLIAENNLYSKNKSIHHYFICKACGKESSVLTKTYKNHWKLDNISSEPIDKDGKLMKVIKNNYTIKEMCTYCGSILEINHDDDISFELNNKNKYDCYVICPCCGRKTKIDSFKNKLWKEVLIKKYEWVNRNK